MALILSYVLGMVIAVPSVLVIVHYAHPSQGIALLIGIVVGCVSVMCASVWVMR